MAQLSWSRLLNSFCAEEIAILELHVIPNVCSEYSEQYFSKCQRIISKSTYSIA